MNIEMHLYRWLLVLTVAFSMVGSLFSQATDARGENEQFVKTYLESKNYKSEFDIQLFLLFTKHHISRARFSELLEINLVLGKLELTENEKSFVTDLHALKIEDEKLKKKYEEEVCRENGIAVDRYNELLTLYNSRIEFQRSLKPIFEKQMKL